MPLHILIKKEMPTQIKKKFLIMAACESFFFFFFHYYDQIEIPNLQNPLPSLLLGEPIDSPFILDHEIKAIIHTLRIEYMHPTILECPYDKCYCIWDGKSCICCHPKISNTENQNVGILVRLEVADRLGFLSAMIRI